MAAGAFEPFYLRIFVADRALMAQREIELPYRKLPGSRRFLLDVRARTRPGEVIAIAGPFPESYAGYEYLYSRSFYPLAGRVVVPISEVAKADVIASYRAAPNVPDFAEVWRGPDGVLLRRTR